MQLQQMKLACSILRGLQARGAATAQPFYVACTRLFSTPVETRTAWTPQQGSGISSSMPTAGATAPAAAHVERAATASQLPAQPSPLHPVLEEVHLVLQAMGLKCGRHCVVGDGLAEVPLGLWVQGKQIAIELLPSTQSEASMSATDIQRSRMMDRIRDRVLAAHNWQILRLTEDEWAQAGASGQHGQGSPDGDKAPLTARHHMAHYVLSRLKETLGSGQKDEHKHGCGSCSCH